jgi:hypothetical protein
MNGIVRVEGVGSLKFSQVIEYIFSLALPISHVLLPSPHQVEMSSRKQA